MLDPWESLFDPHEIARIYGYITERVQKSTSLKWLKYQAMFTILADTGVRVGEMCNLLRENIILENDPPYVRVKRLKKKKPTWDVIPLADATVARLRPYLESGSVGAGLLFKTRNGKPYVGRMVWRIWKGLLKDAGIRHRRLHALRHTLGTDIVEQSQDLVACQHQLGHKDPRITAEFYAHTRMRRQRDILNQVVKAREAVLESKE